MGAYKAVTTHYERRDERHEEQTYPVSPLDNHTPAPLRRPGRGAKGRAGQPRTS
ncbi:hypothetical protein [Nocardia brasiliensis]|uniref:hypothetical protein n=1 Tax=Nocardia brasiliensis TaxID=37326 RepID=UPI00030934A3|nr:hypothetical protein [Nocardia brasiliensis]